MGKIPDDKENSVIETDDVTYKIEKVMDKRIIKVKACKNNQEVLAKTETEND